MPNGKPSGNWSASLDGNLNGGSVCIYIHSRMQQCVQYLPSGGDAGDLAEWLRLPSRPIPPSIQTLSDIGHPCRLRLSEINAQFAAPHARPPWNTCVNAQSGGLRIAACVVRLVEKVSDK